MFVIHFFILENKSFPDALKASKSLLTGHGTEAFRMLLFNNLLLTVISIILYYLVFLAAALFIFFSVERTMVITVFLSVYPRISILFFIILLMACYLSNFNIISQLYQRYQGKEAENRMNWQAAPPEDYVRLKALRKYKLSLDTLIIIAVTAGLCNSYMTIRNDSFYLKNALSGIEVSSHRGNSHSAPENTLPALENAILAGSDYAEVDVRQTKDGVLVLLHDSNLKRTAGLNRNIGTLDLKDLSQLDAGGWFSSDFIRTKIPTLEEAILLCKGRIRLNIEIKADQKGPMFEENLTALINKYEFERQCLITSSDYNTLVKVKQLNADLKTGLILTAAYGNYFDHTAVDFFSIRSNHITRQVVLNAHRAGKEVHAWTVNKTSEVERMKSIGVDCIITDNPTLTKQVLFEDHAGMSFLDLLNHLLNDS
jgi:glycerophosphoryl diester phosphodiesterase